MSFSYTKINFKLYLIREGRKVCHVIFKLAALHHCWSLSVIANQCERLGKWCLRSTWSSQSKFRSLHVVFWHIVSLQTFEKQCKHQPWQSTVKTFDFQISVLQGLLNVSISLLYFYDQYSVSNTATSYEIYTLQYCTGISEMLTMTSFLDVSFPVSWIFYWDLHYIQLRTAWK